MADVQIPESYLAGLHELLDLPSPTFAEFVEALGREITPVSEALLVKRLSSQFRHIGEQRLQRVIDAILALYRIRTREGLSVDDFVASLHASNVLEMEPVSWEGAASRLAAVLRFDHLRIISKSLDVLTEYENLLYDARILTDIRPIFGPEVGEYDPTFAIAHNLRLTYDHGGMHREIFIKMDSKGIQALALVLRRALNKERRLVNIMEEKHLEYLREIGDEDKEQEKMA